MVKHRCSPPCGKICLLFPSIEQANPSISYFSTWVRGKINPSTQTSLLLPTARSFKTGEAPGSSSASKKRKKGALRRSFYQFHVPCAKLLMLQKSGDHQLRLVIEIPLFTRFYASQVMQVPSTIRVISENRTHTYWNNSGFEYHNYRWFQVIVYFLPRNVWADDENLRLLTTV